MALDMPSGGASPSPRSLRGEGWGEGLSPHGSDSRSAPSSRPSPRKRGEGEAQRRGPGCHEFCPSYELNYRAISARRQGPDRRLSQLPSSSRGQNVVVENQAGDGGDRGARRGTCKSRSRYNAIWRQKLKCIIPALRKPVWRYAYYAPRSVAPRKCHLHVRRGAPERHALMVAD